MARTQERNSLSAALQKHVVCPAVKLRVDRDSGRRYVQFGGELYHVGQQTCSVGENQLDGVLPAVED